MKRGYGIYIIAILLSSNSILAQNYFLDQNINSLGNAFASLFSPIFGVGYGEFLFAKIMLFFLLFAIIFASIGKIDLFEENKSIHVILTTITSILAVRYLEPGEFINAILLPYTALGASLATFLPLIIFFYFVHKSGLKGFGRKAAWAIYGIFFIMLWATREYDSLGSANWVYVIGIGFIITCFIFDKSIRKYFTSLEYAEFDARINDARAARLEVEKENLLGANVLSDRMKRRLKKINKELSRINRY